MSEPTTTGTTTGSTPRVHYPLGWLRGIAALSVVTFHAYQHNRTGAESAWPWSGPAHQAMLGTDLFVDLFFVLSGLVLWLPVARSVVDGEPARSGRSLLLRRMARLLPLYLTVVLLVWTLTNPSLPGHWLDLLTHVTFTHVYSDTYIFWTDGPAWSLAVEFHFYLLVALAVPVVGRLGRRVAGRTGRVALVAALPVLLLLVTGAYLTWATVLADVDPTDWSVWFSPLSRAADFGIGMLLAVLAAAGLRLGRLPRGLLAVLGTGATLTLVMHRPFTEVGEWWHPLYALTIAVGLASIVLHRGPWPAALSWRPLTWVGGLGYGVYLIHEPVMRLLDHLGALPEPRAGGFFVVIAIMVALPTVALAWLSSVSVEAAGLRLLGQLERDGSSREYYPHVVDPPRLRQSAQAGPVGPVGPVGPAGSDGGA